VDAFIRGVLKQFLDSKETWFVLNGQGTPIFNISGFSKFIVKGLTETYT
jgi:hypothetical protein